MPDKSYPDGSPPLGADHGAAGQVRLTLRAALDMARKRLNDGAYAAAAELYRQIVQAFGQNFEALHNLGIALHKLGRNDEALAAIDRAIQARPDDVRGVHARAGILAALERYDEAIECFRQVLRSQPDCVEAWCNLAGAYMRQGKLDLAAEAIDRAAELRPGCSDQLIGLGIAYQGQRKFQQAEAVFRRVLQSNPASAPALANLAAAVMDQGRLDEAMEALTRAQGLAPHLAGVRVNMGTALVRMGRYDEAMEKFDQAVRIDPDDAAAHFSRGIILLRRGDLAEGWKEYRWRWRWNEFVSVRLARRFNQPPWDGRNMEHRPILIHFEQGIGDVIQFVRYVPRVIQERSGGVVLEVQDSLLRLAGRISGIERIVPAGADLGSVWAYCAVMDLPAIFGTTLETIPADVPYLSPYPQDVQAWQQRLGRHDRFRVGLAWAGNPVNPIDARRSIGAALLRPLVEIAGIDFYSLQVGRNDDLPQLGADKVTDLSPHLKDFADTAAAISQLDLVISVDSAVAHLAGAMGKKVWLMLCRCDEWRWLENRQDSPWYPTMRIFRQEQDGDWPGVIGRIAAALKEGDGTKGTDSFFAV